MKQIFFLNRIRIPSREIIFFLPFIDFLLFEFLVKISVIWQILLLGLYYMDEMRDRTFMVAFVFQQPTA